MLSANTAWLVPNTTKKPMDDPAFRKAVAHSIDTKKIVEGVYGNLVKAAEPDRPAARSGRSTSTRTW